MGNADSVVRNVDKRTSRREHRAVFEAAVERFRAAPFNAPTPRTTAAFARGLRVCVRKRPLFPHERAQGEFDALTGFPGRIVVHDARMHADMRRMFMSHHDFAFDEVFDETANNEAVYARTAEVLAHNAVQGGRGTVMMYGQTGSGKTYTMTSLYQMASEDLFASSHKRNIHVLFVELLGDTCYDMLNGGAPCNLVTATDGAVHPYPCVEVSVESPSELMALIHMAGKLRATAATGVHDQSSRSHALCRVFVEQLPNQEDSIQCSTKETACAIEGSLTLVDLAGTEHRVDNAEHNAERQREGAKINASLAALKDCIRQSAAGAKFVAFRQNRLTQLLRGCFNSLEPHPTVVIATVSPSSKDTEHSLNTLRHACIMDGQGDGKARQSAHLVGGIARKEFLGEVDVTKIARDRNAARRAGKSPPADRSPEWGRPPPTHQTKQSNVVKRAALDRRCVNQLPAALAERLLQARRAFGTERQRQRLGHPSSHAGACVEEEDMPGVADVPPSYGPSSAESARDSAELSSTAGSPGGPVLASATCPQACPPPPRVPNSWESTATSSASHRRQAAPASMPPAQERNPKKVGGAHSPSPGDVHERPPLCTSAVSPRSQRSPRDGPSPQRHLSGAPSAIQPDGSCDTPRSARRALSPRGAQPPARVKGGSTTLAAASSSVSTSSVASPRLGSRRMQGRRTPPPERADGASSTEHETSLADAVSAERDKAVELFRNFWSEGRSAQVWRKNDLRLINTHVVPELFGPYTQIAWNHPNVALDELERLIAQNPELRHQLQASGPGDPSGARSRRPRGRQASQAERRPPVSAAWEEVENPFECRCGMCLRCLRRLRDSSKSPRALPDGMLPSHAQRPVSPSPSPPQPSSRQVKHEQEQEDALERQRLHQPAQNAWIEREERPCRPPQSPDEFGIARAHWQSQVEASSVPTTLDAWEERDQGQFHAWARGRGDDEQQDREIYTQDGLLETQVDGGGELCWRTNQRLSSTRPLGHLPPRSSFSREQSPAADVSAATHSPEEPHFAERECLAARAEADVRSWLAELQRAQSRDARF